MEAVWPFSAVAVRDGRLVDRLGEPISSTWRSAAKPFQLRCSLEALGDPDVPPEELAVGSASHAGEPRHLAHVRDVLERFSVAEDDLRCAPHPPLWVEATYDVVRAGGSFMDIHNNCSGKHAFMLAASLRRGWDPDYRSPDHPLQRRIREAVVEGCRAEPGHAVDGCGVPTFVLPLEAFARAWAGLAEAMAGEGDPVLGTIGRAMEAFPELTSGTGRLDLQVAEGARESLVVKIGAEGLHCLALPERRLGVVVKMHAGAGAGLGLATQAALETFASGSWAPPGDWEHHRVRNVAGRQVGDRVVEL